MKPFDKPALTINEQHVGCGEERTAPYQGAEMVRFASSPHPTHDGITNCIKAMIEELTA